jgi:hypothetical protein
MWKSMKNAAHMVLESNINYTSIIFTRPDLIFLKPYSLSSHDLNAGLLVHSGVLNQDSSYANDDLFFSLPYNHIGLISAITKKTLDNFYIQQNETNPLIYESSMMGIESKPGNYLYGSHLKLYRKHNLKTIAKKVMRKLGP